MDDRSIPYAQIHNFIWLNFEQYSRASLSADVAATVHVADATDKNQRGDSEQCESRETRDVCVCDLNEVLYLGIWDLNHE